MSDGLRNSWTDFLSYVLDMFTFGIISRTISAMILR